MKGTDSSTTVGGEYEPDQRAERREQRRLHLAERKAARNAVSVSIIVVLALVLVAVGVGGGFLLTRSRIPSSLTSSTDAGSIMVSSAPFDDSRSVSLSVGLGSSTTVISPISGTVTASTCTVGGTIASGGSLMDVDAVPVLALHTQMPLYRTLTSGMSGADARSLNQTLRALGYAAPDSDWMTWETITAYNALANTVGAKRLTAESGWGIGPESFMWLPAESLGIASCSISVGQQATSGQAVFVSAATPVKATLPTAANDVVAGDRTLVISEQTFDIPSGATELTDAALLSAIAASTEYRLAILSGGSGGSSGGAMAADAGTASSTVGSGALSVSYTWRLKTPISAVTVPPSAVTHVSGSLGCVASAGESVPVRIISSQLGKTMVEAENDADITMVEIKPTDPKPCR